MALTPLKRLQDLTGIMQAKLKKLGIEAVEDLIARITDPDEREEIRHHLGLSSDEIDALDERARELVPVIPRPMPVAFGALPEAGDSDDD